MQSHRNNPASEENQRETLINERYIFARKKYPFDCDGCGCPLSYKGMCDTCKESIEASEFNYKQI